MSFKCYLTITDTRSSRSLQNDRMSAKGHEGFWLPTLSNDYFFHGNRTQQNAPVANAVPRYLARQIAQLLLLEAEINVRAGET
jgi:site-specific DNA-cytosine methylase